MDPQDVSKLLEEQQTGQYVPTEEEKAQQESLAQGPRKPIGTNITRIQDFYERSKDPSLRGYNEDLTEEASLAGWGRSRFDRGTFEPGMDLENSRAIEQSGGSKILNGAIKGGITAATTAVETVAGVIDGLLEGGYELGRQIVSGEGVDISTVVGRGVNNFTARTMANIQQLSEEWFPNYRTEYERSDKYQNEWWKHIGSANFIGDSFLKNFGFTIGAIAGGATWSKVLSAGLKAATASNLLKGVVAAAEKSPEAKAALENALRLVEEGKIMTITDDPGLMKVVGGAAKSLNKMSTLHQLFGGVIGAMGEGTFEGVMARNEFTEKSLSDLKEKYLQDMQEFNDEDAFAESLGGTKYVLSIPVTNPDGSSGIRYRLNDEGRALLASKRDEVTRNYIEGQQFINEMGDRIASTTFMWNLPILTVSNTMQFGRMLSGGFDTARSAAKTAGKIAMKEGKLVGEVTAKNAWKGALLGKSALYSVKNAGAEAAEEMSQGFISSGAKKVADARLTAFNDDGFDRESLKDLGNWMNGMLEGGMEYLKDGRNWQEGFLGMMTGLVGIPSRHWQGGIPEAVRQARAEITDSQKAADALNTLVESERFQNAMKGYIRHQKYEKEMADGVASDDKYAWETASDKQLVSDIITFANAGRLKDLEDIVDYYAAMPEDDSNGLEVVQAATGEHNSKEVSNNPEKVVKNVKNRAQEIKDNIRLYNSMYDAMTTIAPMGTSSAQIEEMVAASMNVKAFEKRYLSMFDEVLKGLEPYVRKVAETDENGNPLQNEEARMRRAKEIYGDIASVFTNVEVPLNPLVIEAFEATKAISDLKDIVERSGDDTLKKKIEDMKKIALDRKAFVNKILTLKGLSSSEFEQAADNADKVNQELKQEDAKKEAESLTSLQAVRQAFATDKKKNFGDPAEFLTRMRRIRNENEHVNRFLDIYDAYSDLRSTFIRQGGNLSGVAKDMVEKLFDQAEEKEDLLDETKVPTYDEWQASQREKLSGGEIDSILGTLGNRMEVTPETFNAIADRVKRAIRDIRESIDAAEGRKERKGEPAPKPVEKKDVVSGGAKEDADPSTVGPDPSAKKTASISKDGQTAIDAAGRTWTVGETVYCYDGTKANPESEEFVIQDFYTTKRGEVKATLTGPRQMKVSLVHQVPFIHKALPEKKEEVAPTPVVPVVTPTVTEVGDDAAKEAFQEEPNTERVESEQNSYGQKRYYQTGLPEFEVESAKEVREARKLAMKTGSANDWAKVKEAIRKLVDFIAPRKDDKVIKKLISENAWTNMVKHVEVGDEVQFIGIPGFTGRDGKPVIFMAVEKDGQRYIFNVMRRAGKGFDQYEGLQDFVDAFDYAYEHRTGNPNDEFVFSKKSTVWAKRDGIIDYSYEDDFSGERPIVKMNEGHMQAGIDGYDENAPIVWINGDGNFETLRGDPGAVQKVQSFMNMTQQERNSGHGRLYYLADSGNGGYIPIRLGLEHVTTQNMDTDTADFAAVRRSLTNIQGIAGSFFNRVKNAANDEEKAAILEEENKRLHEEVGTNLKKYVNLAHGFFHFRFSKEGAPILMYDANPAITEKHASDHFEGFILGENNYDMLLRKFAEQKVSFDLRPKENLEEFLRKGYITSNAKKLLPKQTDVYIWRYKDGEFVPTESQKELMPKKTVPDVDEEFKKTSPEPVEDAAEFVPVGGAGEDGGFSFVDDFDAGEFGPAEKVPEFTPTKTPWQQLTEEQQKALTDHYGPEIQEYFDDPTTSPEDRQDKLECVGVS